MVSSAEPEQNVQGDDRSRIDIRNLPMRLAQF